MKRTLLLSLLAASAALAPTLHSAEPKKVIVCTVTTGFRHSSIPDAEKTLKQLGAEDIEQSEGTIINGDWQDFDPLQPPHLLAQDGAGSH